MSQPPSLYELERDFPKPFQAGENYKGWKLTYDFIVPDNNGWVDNRLFIPANFDLVMVKLESGVKVFGWIEDKKWNGNKLFPISQVSYWFHPYEGRKKNIKRNVKEH